MMKMGQFDEKRELFRKKWESFPEKLRVPQQVAGVVAVGCGATHGVMERCNFSCTSCYLTDAADATQPLSFEEVLEQLVALREHLGEGGKVQITSGEVTLLPKQELGRIVAAARGLGLDPMVMTNGERFLRNPGYLETLVTEFGLAKIGFHVDVTQPERARPGARGGEEFLHPIRDRFATLVRETRRKTGRPLFAAHTVTVTERSLDGVPAVVSWALANADAVRIVSFQPSAPVGRTRDRPTGALNQNALWRRIEAGAGRSLNRDAMYFGHPGCNVNAPVIVVTCGPERHLVEVVRKDEPWDLRVFAWMVREIGVEIDLDEGELRSAARALRLLLLQPHRLMELALYGLYRAWGERRAIRRLVGALVRGSRLSVRPLLFVIHEFMSAEELETPAGHERLAACVFRLPVAGRMVPMCEMNATPLRRETHLRRLG